MKAILSKELFKKEPKKIIRTLGLLYAGFGTWCFFGLNLMNSTMSNFPKGEEVNGFNQIFDILKNIWSIYMPLLIVIGVGMVAFSYAFERLQKNRILIQTGILIVSSIWVIAYSLASIPYIKAFMSISPENEMLTGIKYIFSIFGFGAVLAFMTLPNLKVLKKMKEEKGEIQRTSLDD